MSKLSLYTHLFEDCGKHYLYNCETGLFAEIGRELYAKLVDRDFAAIDRDTMRQLRKQKVVVREDELYTTYDEAKMRFHAQAYDPETLSLVLVPFSGCNFACPYCFEKNKEPHLMSDATIEHLVKFVNGHKRAKRLSLTWYGGEPLAAFPTIQKIHRRLTEGTQLPIVGHSIVTNGYLLDDAMLDFFAETRLDSLQITLDGTEERHNRTRFLKATGEGTFQVILRHIDDAVRRLPDCRISIRVNINKDNEADFILLYRELGERYSGKKVHIYPGLIREDTTDACSLCYRSFKGEEVFPLYRRLDEAGAHVEFFPHTAKKGCMVHWLNAYIVGPRGEIYKCWNDVGDARKVVGYIHRRQLSNRALLARYMNDVSAFADPACRSCSVFPICDGGCANYRYRNRFEGKHYEICTGFRHEDLLRQTLIRSQKPQESTLPALFV